MLSGCFRALWHTGWFLIAVCAFAQDPASHQTPPQVIQSDEVLRTRTRLVIVDVVATDSKGELIRDLKADEFLVYEDGKKQAISNFTFQEGKTATDVVRPAASDFYSNAPQYRDAGNLNVILLDALNADTTTHFYAREQLIKYLAAGPSIQPTALYLLEDKLTLLHGFSTDPSVLKAALEDLKPRGTAHVQDVYTSASPFAHRGETRTSVHTEDVTMAALTILAQALAGYPGRKNLIWVSEGFPITLFPDIIFNDPGAYASPNSGGGGVAIPPPQMTDHPRTSNSGKHDFAAELEKLANMMMGAQVAIYPVDSAALGTSNRLNALGTMQGLAERTGGKAYFSRNDLDGAIRSSINDGSTYYTLAYYPDNKEWNGKFRAIQLKTVRAGAALRYRQGYYALDPDAGSKDAEKTLGRDFSQAMGLDAPGATAVQFRASVAQKVPRLLVKFAIDPHTLLFSRKDDGREETAVSCAIFAYSEKGVLLKQEINSQISTVNAENFPKLMKSALGCERAIDLKPGNYKLVLGVVDRKSRMMGTTTAQVQIP